MFNLLLTVLTLYHVYQESGAAVRVEFGNEFKPIVSRSDNLTILENSQIVLKMQCVANYPTEWIFDSDPVTINFQHGRNRQEWTVRKFRQDIDEHEYRYGAWIRMEYKPKVIEQETWLCRAVSNHNDNMTIKLTPNDTHAFLTHHPNYTVEITDIPSQRSPTNECNVRFYFVQLKSGYYWQCELEDGTVTPIELRNCQGSANCASSFRKVKERGSCVTVVKSSETSSIDTSTWKRMNNDKTQSPGVAVCSDGSGSEEGRRAVEYFFGLTNTSKPKLHFSWSEIEPEDLIWLETANSDIYTGDTIESKCWVSTYGFAFDPVLRIKLNGSKLSLARDFDQIRGNTLFFKKVELSLNKTGAGHYEIECIAPFWNTTKWIKQARSILVKDPVPPQFKVSFEKVTYQDGDTDKTLKCDPIGDPIPTTIVWESAGVPYTHSEDATFTIAKVTKLLTDQVVIKCIATNQFGQTATKSFQINVEGNENVTSGGTSSTIIIIIVAGVVFVVFLLFVGLTFLYVKFLRLAQVSSLTYAEVKEFREGRPRPLTTMPGQGQGKAGRPVYENTGMEAGDYENYDVDSESSTLMIECLPYNNEFEVMRDLLIVDFNQVLGSGEYGIVYRGEIKLNGKDKSGQPVAVKTVKKDVHVNYYKALLSELKILAYIGHHTNIANLVGAHTSNIKNRELFVGVELCDTSLVKCLQENRNTFKNLVVNDALVKETSFTDYQNQMVCNANKTISTHDLINWSGEIASGMEFLSKKKIVHGDLAARNVLISFELHAKICDFGLARQLVDYNYIKSQHCPLPWKWMALESLSQMKFSTKTDVWAYGVTLWEVFSLGNIPYPGLTWNMDFVDQLNSGLRMSKPPFASHDIFNIMRKCWQHNPKDRPNFTELKQHFKSLEVK